MGNSINPRVVAKTAVSMVPAPTIPASVRSAAVELSASSTAHEAPSAPEMKPELLKAMISMGPLTKTVHRRLPTSPEELLDEYTPERRRRSIPGSTANSERNLPKARHAVTESALALEWKELAAAPGSGKLSEVQAVGLLELQRDQNYSATEIATKYHLDAATVKTLLANYGSPRLALDKKTGIRFGSWESKFDIKKI